MREAGSLGDVCGDVAGLAEDAKVGLGLGAIVEAEDGNDRTDEFGGKGDAAFADAVADAFEHLMDEGDAEGFLHGGYGAAEFDGAAFGAGSVGCDGEAVLFGESADQLNCGGVGAVALAILSVSEALFANSIGGFERGFATDDDGDGDLCPGWRGLFSGGGNEGSFGASWQDGAGRNPQGDGFFRR
jgi:hypothetical protein